MKTSLIAATLGALVLTSAAAEARVYRWTNNQNFASVPNTAGFYVPITNGGATSTTISLPTASLVAFTYSAECYNAGGGWTYVAIEVDGIALPPTNNNDFAFCASTAYTSASMTTAKSLAAGAHVVRIRAQRIAGATASFLDDSALVIHD